MTDLMAEIFVRIVRKDPTIVMGLISPIGGDFRKAKQELSAHINLEMAAWCKTNQGQTDEAYTLDDAKEAMFICRACHGPETLVRAMAAALNRARKEGAK